MYKIVVTYGNMRGVAFARKIKTLADAEALLALAISRKYTDAEIRQETKKAK